MGEPSVIWLMFSQHFEIVFKKSVDYQGPWPFYLYVAVICCVHELPFNRSGRYPRCGWKPIFHLNGGESVTNHPDAGGNLYSTWMGVNQSLLTRIRVEGSFIWHFCLFLGNMLLERYILMCWNMKIGFLSCYFNCMILFSSYLAFPMVKHGRLVGDGSTVSCKSLLIVHLKAMIVNRKGV